MRYVCWFPVLLVFLALGCGPQCPSLGNVYGTVSYRGKPLATGSLIIEVSGARPAHAKIVSGQITEASTYEVDDGVPVGLARIAVFAEQASTKSSGGDQKPMTPQQALAGGMNYGVTGKSLIPAKYNNPATSGLTHNITPGDNHLTLDLQ